MGILFSKPDDDNKKTHLTPYMFNKRYKKDIPTVELWKIIINNGSIKDLPYLNSKKLVIGESDIDDVSVDIIIQSIQANIIEFELFRCNISNNGFENFFNSLGVSNLTKLTINQRLDYYKLLENLPDKLSELFLGVSRSVITDKERILKLLMDHASKGNLVNITVYGISFVFDEKFVDLMNKTKIKSIQFESRTDIDKQVINKLKFNPYITEMVIHTHNDMIHELFNRSNSKEKICSYLMEFKKINKELVRELISFLF
jgi:hypothetical protein